MKKLRKLWKNDFAKFIISFFGLILLFLTILIQPGLTYVFGDEITVRVYENYDEGYAAYGLLGINQVSIDLMDDTLKTRLLDEDYNPFNLTDDYTVYAIFDTSLEISTIQEVTVINPSNEDVYLIVDDLFLLREPESQQSQLVDVRIDLIEDTLYDDYFALFQSSSENQKDITVKIWRDHLIVTDRD